MKRNEIIKRYGEEEYARRLESSRTWTTANRDKKRATANRYREEHPEQGREWRETHREEVKSPNDEINRKGGKYYARKIKYQQTGIPGDRHRIRMKHGNKYHPYKAIIAPDSQIHHEWVPGTAEYRGVALVEAEQHMHGFVDVIKILEGKITLLTEEQKRAEGN